LCPAGLCVIQEQKKIDRIKCKGDTEGLHPDDASLMAHYQVRSDQVHLPAGSVGL